MGDQAGAGAHVQRLLAPFGRGDLDEASRHAAVQAAGPTVVLGRDLVEEVDQVVDHFICGVGIHYGRGRTSEWA